MNSFGGIFDHTWLAQEVNAEGVLAVGELCRVKQRG